MFTNLISVCNLYSIIIAIALTSKDHTVSIEKPDDTSSITDSAYGAGSISICAEVSQDVEVRCNLGEHALCNNVHY